ncbi:IS1595 family transposase [Mesorhizobium sp. B3-1-6]|uniref:IS1595 family transposase n=1 Tax=Mesorhizobium sp. B3-1-6 TaxID=2589895 RepID=UPI00112B5ADE|nr:IS1595 family transposase [Mesorhizobium sp. B3-1-6]TPI31513.1 IS1595 family transposase [Mesorhizobium sp. B3-1-6]
MFDLTNEIYHDADKAREHLEAIHWPHGPFCPHCGNANPERVTKLAGKSTRPGVYKCNECRLPFSVTVGTVFERSKIGLHKWVLATHLLGASKKGISAHQLHRMLGVTYKTAWFMAHRIREAMAEDVKSSGPLGGEGKIVEADETYFGPKDRVVKRTIRGKPANSSKRSIVALVERGGKARMFHVERATKESVRDVLVRNADRKSTLMTDESNFYPITGLEFADHATVKHTGGEYVRYEADRIVHTNTIENVFSVFKRGMVGVYQHCGEAHLHRYLAEFDFRYNRRTALKISDAERAEDLLRMARDKRLTYRRIGEASYA